MIRLDVTSSDEGMKRVMFGGDGEWGRHYTSPMLEYAIIIIINKIKGIATW
jgi:hypothetical protein